MVGMDFAHAHQSLMATRMSTDDTLPIIEKMDFDLTSAGYALCIVNTGGNHADLNEDYASVPAEMKAVAAKLGVPVLRDTCKCALDQLLSENGAALYTVDQIDLNYSDVVPFAKQLLLGQSNSLVLAAKMVSLLKNSGMIWSLVLKP